MEILVNQTVTRFVFHAIVRRVRFALRVRRGTKVWFNRDEYALHMDNAPAHRSHLVQGYLAQHKWPVLKHLPYSPDLSPADFFLFPRLKKKLWGTHHGSVDRLKELIWQEVGLISHQEWQNCFTDWIRRCHQCVLFRGNYFEGMVHPPT